jgi:hypothetical protein
VAADERVQGGASGGEGVAEDTAGAGGVRRVYFESSWEGERRAEAESGDAAVGAHACSRNCTRRTRVLRGEGHHNLLGGEVHPSFGSIISSVEMLSEEQGAFVSLPSLSCGEISHAAAVAVDESDSAAGQVLLLGGVGRVITSKGVRLVDLATGTCTRQPDMLHARYHFAAARLKDGRVVCAGGGGLHASSISAEVYGPPVQGAPGAPWTWTELPAMSVGRHGCSGCVMSDGRFAVLGGVSNVGDPMSSCEALVVGDDAHWELLPPMHESRAERQ